MKRRKLLFIFGTRPEIIKLAPVIHRAKSDPGCDVSVLHTGQHGDLAADMLTLFDIKPDYNLNVMQPNQSLYAVSSRILDGLSEIIGKNRFEIIVVQGDTTSAFFGALAAFYSKIPVAHVEAGLRTKNRYNPFPEEMNRRLIGSLANLHFPPTMSGRNSLMSENIDEKNIIVTGNTVIDALLWALERPYSPPQFLAELFASGSKLLLVTTHRRESFGEPHRNVFNALLDIVANHDSARVIFPVHPNPAVRSEVGKMLKDHPRIHLCAPLSYLDFIHTMKNAFIILSDSGGVQEEAPTLKKPVLVLRDTTERPEGLESGALKMVGTDRKRIVSETAGLFSNETLYKAMIANPNPYGDGNASERIVTAISEYLDKYSGDNG